MHLEPSLNKKILIQTGPDMKLIAFDSRGKKFEPKKVRGKKKISLAGMEQDCEQIIDIFSLKILALLMCRGSPKEKSQLLMDLVIGREDVKKGTESV